MRVKHRYHGNFERSAPEMTGSSRDSVAMAGDVRQQLVSVRCLLEGRDDPLASGESPLAHAQQILRQVTDSLGKLGCHSLQEAVLGQMNLLRRYQSQPVDQHSVPAVCEQLCAIEQALAEQFGSNMSPVSVNQESCPVHQPRVVDANVPYESECQCWDRIAFDLDDATTDGQTTGVVESGDETDDELLAVFLNEAMDNLDSATEALNQWLESNDAQLLIALQRHLHTIKGGARMTGMDAVGNLAHKLEDLYEALVLQRLQVSGDLISLLMRSHDKLEDMFSAIRSHKPNVPAEKLCAEIHKVMRNIDTAPVFTPPAESVVAASKVAEEVDDEDWARLDDTPEPSNGFAAELVAKIESGVEPLAQPKIQPRIQAMGELNVQPKSFNMTASADASQDSHSSDRIAAPAAMYLHAQAHDQTEKDTDHLVRVSSSLLDNLVNLVSEASINFVHVEQRITSHKHVLGEVDQTIQRLKEQLKRLDIETQSQIRSHHLEGDDKTGFDPLEMDQYSEINQLSRSLAESITDLVNLNETMLEQNHCASILLLHQIRNHKELQEGIISTRMLPFERLVPRFERILQKLSRELHKPVDLVVNKTEGEIDRTLIERIIEPLEHMLRNAIDHGIEATSEQRVAAGKPARGQIHISMQRDGRDMVLKISDDGQGIDLEKLRKQAQLRGLLAPDDDISDEQVVELIFAPGLSLAPTVTQISGRGFGMDIVQHGIQVLGGHIEVSSSLGQGTEFTIRLPCTLSLNRALLVCVGSEQYAVPLSSLEGVVRLSASKLRKQYQATPPYIIHDRKRYQLHYLGQLLQQDGVLPCECQSECPVLLLRFRNQRIAVHVDNLLDNREIMTKSLGPQFADLKGVSGATILADGRVATILDLGELINARLSSSTSSQQVFQSSASSAREVEPHLIMIVDDSIVVRKVTSRLLQKNGYRTLTARDGVEAMALLQEHRPDVILLDIEMPRMDGFEVAKAVRNHPEIGDTPIIMITSRSGEKHRQRAMDIGVNGYMGKPYQEASLIEAIGVLVKGC